MHGFLNINKPSGMTSHDVVARVRRLAGRKAKVGHAGTLDPMATGVLPVALGQATRLIEYLADSIKGYRAQVRLGKTTTTDDAEGEIVECRSVPPLAIATIEAALEPFRGEIMQTPPMYSALHHQGKRLYELARAGQQVDIPPRPVLVERLELIGEVADDTIQLDILCGKGTYIRALARDLGAALGCGAHLVGLERTRVGPFLIEHAIPLEDLMRAGLVPEDGRSDRSPLLPLEIAVADWPMVVLSEAQSRRVCNGLGLRLPDLPGDRARAHSPEGVLIALLRRTETEWRPDKVITQL